MNKKKRQKKKKKKKKKKKTTVIMCYKKMTRHDWFAVDENLKLEKH
jgi:hypothetical protein